MKDPESSTRRMTYELTLSTVSAMDQLAIVSRTGKSEMVEASLNWFFALVAAHASCTGVSQAQALRALVDATPSAEVLVLPRYSKDGMGQESIQLLMDHIGMESSNL